jgi:hypothetical protein
LTWNLGGIWAAGLASDEAKLAAPEKAKIKTTGAAERAPAAKKSHHAELPDLADRPNRAIGV